MTTKVPLCLHLTDRIVTSQTRSHDMYVSCYATIGYASHPNNTMLRDLPNWMNMISICTQVYIFQAAHRPPVTRSETHVRSE